MYTISGGRRLITIEDGKYKFIKRNQVFHTERIYVLIKPVKLKKYSKGIYIEKELIFNQGVGNYKLVDSRPLMERIYNLLIITTGITMLLSYIFTIAYDSSKFNVPFSLVLIFSGIWVVLVFVLLAYRFYFKANYERYARELNDCKLVKVD